MSFEWRILVIFGLLYAVQFPALSLLHEDSVAQISYADRAQLDSRFFSASVVPHQVTSEYSVVVLRLSALAPTDPVRMTGGTAQKKSTKSSVADKVNEDQNSQVFLGLEDLKKELRALQTPWLTEVKELESNGGGHTGYDNLC